MIELNEKTQQDFLNREWVQKLLDVGVDMSDAKYWIGRAVESNISYVCLKEWVGQFLPLVDLIPTYTVSELLYKLHEWIYPTINDKEYSGGLRFIKDAPFYMFYYSLKTKDYDFHLNQGEHNDNYIFAEFEYPIESLASLLIQCHKKDIGLKTKDTGNINNK